MQVDTAAFAPHRPLCLSELGADFAVFSFYKVRCGGSCGCGTVQCQVSSRVSSYFACSKDACGTRVAWPGAGMEGDQTLYDTEAWVAVP